MLAGAPAVKAGTKMTIASAKTGKNIAMKAMSNIEKANRAAQDLKSALNVPLNKSDIRNVTNTGRELGQKSIEQMKQLNNTGGRSVGGNRKSKHISKEVMRKHTRLSSARLRRRLKQFTKKRKQGRKNKTRAQHS